MTNITLMNEVNAEIMATNDFLLTDEMVLSAVTRACDFINLPEVPVIHADGTCVWPNDTTTYVDDVLGFNRAQLMEMGISNEDSLTLIYTHECVHRKLQGVYNDSWEEELVCDFFAGVHAGLRDINIDNFEAALGATTGGASHPVGALRVEFIEFGKQIADEMQERGIEVTFDGCLERLNQLIEEKGGLINNDFLLTDEMVLGAVKRACDFINLPEVPVIYANGTCVWPNNTTTYADDVFGFNRAQLMEMGISSEDSLTLIYTHECVHRKLQGVYNDSWEEELVCDFFAGVHAGLRDINIDNFEAALGATTGGASHPVGALRAEFIEFGKQIADEMQDRGIEVTFERCLERLNQHLVEKEGLITEYRQRIDPTYHGFTEDAMLAQNTSTDLTGDTPHANVSGESCGSVGLVKPSPIDNEQTQINVSGESCGSVGLIKQASNDDKHTQSDASGETSESIGSAKDVTIDEDGAKSLTKADINRKVAQAESNRRAEEARAESHTYMAKNSIDKAGVEYYMNKAKAALRRAEEYKQEANRWRNTKPDEE